MRKIIFFLLLSLGLQAQIVSIPDANLKALLLAASSSGSYIASTQEPLLNVNTPYSYYVSVASTVDINGDGEIQVSEASTIKYLNIEDYNICDLSGIENFINLKVLLCSNNNLTNVNLSSNTLLKQLAISNNSLNSLNIFNLNSLEILNCGNNNLNSIHTNSSLKSLTCNNNQISNINISNSTGLEELTCSYNQIQSIDLNGMIDLKSLNCLSNLITSINLTTLINLDRLSISGNPISELNLSSNINLESLNCTSTNLVFLDIRDLPQLMYISCQENLSLESIFCKGSHNIYSFTFSNCPNIKYICSDKEDIGSIQGSINLYGYQATCHVNTYCSFTPGGEFYTIQGSNKLDFDIDGCDLNDNAFPNLKYKITDGAEIGIIIPNSNGEYNIFVQNGTTLLPQLENPTYYNVSPSNLQVNFPSTTSPFNQNFCITPNGIHHDVEVTLIPITPARPGFDATYKIIYKNKGNQVENGSIIFSMYNPNVVDFVSCSPTYNSQTTNASLETFTWNYSNLQPFETREINIVTNLNSPMETPPLNAGAFLSYDAQIQINNSDENTFDNFSGIRQIVVNSYDPNDKTCIEGATITPAMVGKYVHYVIRFENTGTYPAENVVIKDVIDLAKFDIATLIPIRGSHNFETRIAGNKVEFIFENINLPFDDANNDGYVAFKIKTKPTLVLGDTFSNLANIYFDYNFPIITNTATTTIAALSTTDFDFGTHFTLYPNPVKDVLNFQSREGISIHSIEIYTTLGQVVLAVTDTLSSVDVSSLQAGNYIVKVHTDLGVSNTKFIKE